jgi:tRNA threonylcarbamoyladenosine biosynthesis protein TsaE
MTSSILESHFSFSAHSEADTERLGRALAAHLPPGSVVGLDGPLGAGKTRLVQAIVTALGVDRAAVVSPTFVLVHEYHGQRAIYHLDAYRLRDDDEFLQLGADEYFCPPNLVLIEWAERIASCLPLERLTITIHAAPGEQRQFNLLARGAKYQPIIERLRHELS